MLLYTIGILAILIIISFAIFDRDIFAPPTVVSLVFLFGALCTFYNEERWQLDFSYGTMMLVVMGVVSFIAGGAAAVFLSNLKRQGSRGFAHETCAVEYLDISKFKTLLVILFQLLTIVMLVIQLRRITGGGSWKEVVAIFRGRKSLDPEQNTLKLSWMLKQFISVSFYIALFYAYIVGNNIAVGKRQPIINWLPVILSSSMSIMQGYRSDILRYWIAILVVAYMLKKRSIGWKHGKSSRKMIRAMALSVVCIAVLFVAARGLVGRSSTKDPFYYLTFYAGCPLAAFDVFVKKQIEPSDIWGKETFYNLNQNIGSLLHKPELRYRFFHEFSRSPNGTSIGNVYTALRAPYYDFGKTGMIIFMFVMGAFFTFFYLKVRKRNGKSQIDMWLLIYSYVAYTFFMYFYNCYNTFISLSIVKAAVLFMLFRWFFLKVRYGRDGIVLF